MIHLLLFELSGTFPIVKNNCLQLVIMFLIKKYLLDNYNHLRYKKKKKKCVSGIESKEF